MTLRTRSTVLPALALAALTAGGCGPGSAGEGEAGGAPPPPEVTIVTIEPRPVELPFEYPGRVEGSREVEVRPRVAGILLRRLYDEGRPVRRGEALFQIDPAPYRAEVQAAEASLAEERAKLANAGRELARLRPLAEARAVSRRQLDAAISDEEQARALVLSAQARLDKAKLDLAWTRVEAPIGGVTSRAELSEGSLVGPESLLTRISQVRPIWVRFAMSDRELLDLEAAIASRRVDAPPAGRREVELVLADGTAVPERGQVNFSDPMIDPSTGSVELRAELANEDGGLVPGQFVRVRMLGMTRPAAILLPQRAVLQGQQGKFVMAVGAGDVVEVKPVEVGRFVGDEWLIEKGLAAGDRVIVDGVVKARPGAPVRIAAPGQEAPAGAPAAPAADAPESAGAGH
jgi:membrane fusion protein (multidrug efflux system)